MTRRAIKWAAIIGVAVLIGLSGSDWLRSLKTASSSIAGSGPVRIAIDSKVRYQTMNGFGTSALVFDDPHVFDNFDKKTRRAATILSREQQDEILDRLYVDLGLTRLRPTFGIGGFEPINDNDDPDVTDLARFDFSWKQNDAQVELAKRAMARGASTIFPTSLGFEDWMRGAAAAPEAAEWIMTRIRRWRELGVELRYYSVINEPGYRRGRIWSGEFIRDVIKLLGPKLRAEGFETLFVVPDDWGPKQAYERSKVILADQEARKYVGALAYHLYRGSRTDLENMKRLSLKYNLQIWMTEYSLGARYYWKKFYNKKHLDFLDWAVLINDMIVYYHVSAVDYMWGFFGEWEPPVTNLIRLKYDGARYRGYELSKQYYATGQFSKYVRPGARRVDAVSSSPAVKVSAYVQEGDLTIVALNTASMGLSVDVSFDTGGPGDGAVLRATRTTARENGVSLPSVTVSGSRFSATLPARSITTFTTIVRAERSSPQ